MYFSIHTYASINCTHTLHAVKEVFFRGGGGGGGGGVGSVTYSAPAGCQYCLHAGCVNIPYVMLGGGGGGGGGGEVGALGRELLLHQFQK